MKDAVCFSAVVWLLLACLVGITFGEAFVDGPPPPAAVQMRCFPPNTRGAEGFLLCPDRRDTEQEDT